MKKVVLLVLVLGLPLFLSGCQLLLPQPPSNSAQDNSTEEIIKCSKIRQAGRTIEPFPYVGGGETRNEGGFDCSGSIHFVQKSIGSPIPRTTSRKLGILANGKNKNGSKSSCGDGTFFTFSSNRPKGHVGMITDNSIFYQSGSSTGPTKEIFVKNKFWDNKHIGTKSPNLE